MRLPLQRLLSTMATPIEDALRQKARTTQLPYPTYPPIYPSIHPSIRIHYVLLLLTHPIHSFISLVYIYIYITDHRSTEPHQVGGLQRFAPARAPQGHGGEHES